MTPVEIHELEVKMAHIEEQLGSVDKKVSEFKEEFNKFREKVERDKESYFVLLLSKESFKSAFGPIQKLAWAMTLLVLSGVVAAGLSFILRKGG
jgi:predicted nuclease with TOPRIM domain